MQERARRYTVRKRKDQPQGPFYLHWAENGRQRRRNTGLFEKDLAEALCDRLNAEAAERAVFGRAVIETRVTFAYAALAWLEASETPDQRAARQRFLTIPIERLGDYALRDIDDDVMRDESRKAYPLAAPATRRRQFYGPAMAVMNWASKRARKWCDKPDFERPADAPAKTDWVAPALAANIIDAVAAAGARRPLRVIPYELGFGAGLRASEAARLDWADIYLTSGQIRVRGEKTNAADRLVDIPPRTVAALANLPHREGRVCRTPAGKAYVIRKTTGGLFNAPLATACKNAKTAIVTFHTLRHSWATWRASADKDLIRLMSEGGWADLRMVQRYAKLAPRATGPEAAALGWDFAGPQTPETASDIAATAPRGRSRKLAGDG